MHASAGAAPLWWESYQFTWMSVHPECNVPVRCLTAGMDAKEILLLGDSMQHYFLETMCYMLGGHGEIGPWGDYDTPSNCSIDGGHHITHHHLIGMSPQPPYFMAHKHDGSNATTRFHNSMHALPRRPDVVVLNSALWDLARHTGLTRATVVIEGQHHYPTLTTLQEFATNLENFMTLIDTALPGAERVFMTTAMPSAVKNDVEKWNNIMLAGFNAVGTSTAVKLGWHVLDAALLQIGFENKQYYIRDSVHPKFEVMQTWWHLLSHHICS